MKKTIWKFELGFGKSTIEIPEGAKILTMQDQGGVLHLWAAVNPDADLEKRHFVTVGTGGVINEGLEYIGTYQESAFVWHVFERIN